MSFEVGKVYRHDGTGELVDVLGEVTTTGFRNPVLIGETLNGIKPLGSDSDSCQYWSEVPREEWDRAWRTEMREPPDSDYNPIGLRRAKVAKSAEDEPQERP
jgi:hypothetical protein